MSETIQSPRKRPRLDDDEGDSNMQIESGNTNETIMVVHDPTYNSTDGDICVIQVENTIFKVHRFLLSRDSIMFKEMFTAPEVERPQGFTEDNPIVLQDDIEDFRALCWALYALPTELNAELAATGNVRRLNKLARIANKYQFVSGEAWALTTLIHHCQNHKLISKLTPERTLRLLQTASQCNSIELRDIIEAGVIQRMEKGPPARWVNAQTIPEFEQHGSRRLKGMLYYHILQLQEHSAPLVQANTSALKLPIFDPDSERARYIYRGYWSLSKWWEHFVAHSISFPRATQCPPDLHAHCQMRWPAQRAIFFSKVEAPGIARVDVLKRLERIEVAAQELLTTLTSAQNWMITNTSPTRFCLTSWLEKVVQVEKQKLIDTMGDHFFGYVFQPSPTEPTTGSTSNLN